MGRNTAKQRGTGEIFVVTPEVRPEHRSSANKYTPLLRRYRHRQTKKPEITITNGCTNSEEALYEKNSMRKMPPLFRTQLMRVWNLRKATTTPHRKWPKWRLTEASPSSTRHSSRHRCAWKMPRKKIDEKLDEMKKDADKADKE